MALMTEEYRLGRNALPPGLSAADQHRIWPTSCLTTSGPVKCSYQRVTTTDPNVGASNRKCIYSGGEWKYRTGSGANRAFNGVCTGGITYNPYSSDEASSLTLRPSLAGNNLSDANNEDLDVVFCKLNSTSTWVQCRGRCKINGAGTWVHIPGKGKCAKYKAGPALPGMDSDDDPGSPDE